MNVLEIFAGTRSIGKAFEKRGHNVLSIDWDTTLPDIDIYADILTLDPEYIKAIFPDINVIWASPDCTTYSVAAISKHRENKNGLLLPKTEYAEYCDRVNIYLHNLIMVLDPNYWFIENPRGAMRKMYFMQGLPRYTVTYCQYGDNRMKPTDIWTNHPNPQFKPPCKNGDSCHERAPRGSKCGTQRLKGSKERGIIPLNLCDHIVDICEGCNHV